MAMEKSSRHSEDKRKDCIYDEQGWNGYLRRVDWFWIGYIEEEWKQKYVKMTE
jgi:hypothetical protein